MPNFQYMGILQNFVIVELSYQYKGEQFYGIIGSAYNQNKTTNERKEIKQIQSRHEKRHSQIYRL